MKSSRGFSLIEALVLLFILMMFLLVVVVPIVGLSGGLMPNYSDGERTGTIYKFSQKGLIFKSWESEMYLGGVSMSGGDNPQLQMDKFKFSLPENANAALIAQIKECAQTRKLCTVQYSEWFIGPVRQDTSYTARAVISN